MSRVSVRFVGFKKAQERCDSDHSADDISHVLRDLSPLLLDWVGSQMQASSYIMTGRRGSTAFIIAYPFIIGIKVWVLGGQGCSVFTVSRDLAALHFPVCYARWLGSRTAGAKDAEQIPGFD